MKERVLWCFVLVCFVKVTILKPVWRSRCADAPRCAHFPSDICSVIQEDEITVEKCAHLGASACRERHTLSLGRNKHGHNYSAPKGGVPEYNVQQYVRLVKKNLFCEILQNKRVNFEFLRIHFPISLTFESYGGFLFFIQRRRTLRTF